jgi:hypothetical protein
VPLSRPPVTAQYFVKMRSRMGLALNRCLDVRKKAAFDPWKIADVFLNFLIFQKFDCARDQKVPIQCLAT